MKGILLFTGGLWLVLVGGKEDVAGLGGLIEGLVTYHGCLCATFIDGLQKPG